MTLVAGCREERDLSCNYFIFLTKDTTAIIVIELRLDEIYAASCMLWL